MPLYSLPLSKKTIKIWQGYDGEFSHKNYKQNKYDNRYAIDFVASSGTEILASRKGKVTLVIDNNRKAYRKLDDAGGKKYGEFANFVELTHSDGTFTTYYHLKFKGARVKVGDSIKEGQLIGITGISGWLGPVPHLHFSAYKRKYKGFLIKTFPVKFNDYSGSFNDRKLKNFRKNLLKQY